MGRLVIGPSNRQTYVNKSTVIFDEVNLLKWLIEKNQQNR